MDDPQKPTETERFAARRPQPVAPMGWDAPANASERPEIAREEVLRYLGHHGQDVEPELETRIAAAMARARETLRPRGVWAILPVDATGTDALGKPCIRLEGTTLELRGTDAFRHLKDARAAGIMAVTLGMPCERELRRLSMVDPLEATLFDAACSAYVEAAVDEVEARVRACAARDGLVGNWRFSPGYGDCPLDTQPAFLATLNAGRRIGLSATATNLLMPTKSVTAFLGLFDGEVRAADSRPTCAGCALGGACAFRAHGTFCYAGRLGKGAAG